MRQCKQCGASFFCGEGFCTYCGEQMAPGAQREEPRQSRQDNCNQGSNDDGNWDFFAFTQAFSEQDTPPPIRMFRQSSWESIIAAVLAFTLGTFGVHWFFLGRQRRAFFYLIFFWTGIPTILGIVDGIMLLVNMGRNSYYGSWQR